MKKSILILTVFIMALISFQAFAEPIAMNTPAVAAPWWEGSVHKILEVVVNLVIDLFLFWITGLYDYVRKYLATTRYGQEVSILMVSLKRAISNKAKEKETSYKKIVSDITRIVSDFNITPEEKKQLISMRNEIKADAISIAHAELKELRGWTKDKASSYIAERIDLLLGELESGLIDLMGNSTQPIQAKSETPE